MFATALALIASAFSGRDRGVAFGVFGATTGVAVAVGPVLGGVLTSGLSWRWIFFVNIPICLLAIAIAAPKVRESHDPRAGRPDWFGFVTFSLALGALVYGLIGPARPSGTTGASSSAWWPPPCSWWSSWSASCGRSTRCSTSRCCASRPSPAA